MLEKRLKALAAEKAKEIGVSFRGIDVVKKDPVIDGTSFVFANHRLSIGKNGQRIVLHVGDLSDVNDERLELTVEFLMCHCVKGDGMAQGNALMSPINPVVTGTLLEVHGAFSQYFAAKTYLSVYGSARFSRFQYFGLDRFVAETEAIYESEDFCHKTLAVAAYFKEQLKFELIGESPPEIKTVIKKITAPFPASFEEIESSEMPWSGKATVLLFLTEYLLQRVNLVRSYRRNELVTQGTPQGALHRGMHTFGDSDVKIPRTAASIEFMLDSSYFGSAVGAASQS